MMRIKKLLILIGFLLVCPWPASAMTLADSSDHSLALSFYGQINAEFRLLHFHIEGRRETFGFNSGMYQGSYAGLALTKQFASNRLDLRAEVETHIDTIGYSKIQARQLILGLEGGWGRLAFGRQHTPQFRSISAFDPHGLLTDAGLGTTWLITRLGNNLLSYTSPVFHGFSFEAAYSPDLLRGEAIREDGWPRLSYFAFSPRYAGEKFNAYLNLGFSSLHGDLVWDAQQSLPIAAGRVYFAELFVNYDLGFMKLFAGFNYRLPDDVDNLLLLTTPMIRPDEMGLWTAGRSWTFMLGGEWKVPHTENDRFVLTWAYRNTYIPTDRSPTLVARLDKYAAGYYRQFTDSLTGYFNYTILFNNVVMNSHDHFWGGLHGGDGRYRGSLSAGLRFEF